jgi:hypothetical protein
LSADRFPRWRGGSLGDPLRDTHSEKEEKKRAGDALMAQRELSISSDEISAVLRRYVEDYRPTVEREEVGIVREVGDGIARIDGLPNAMLNEMLEFPDGTVALAMNLTEHEIGAVVLG